MIYAIKYAYLAAYVQDFSRILVLTVVLGPVASASRNTNSQA